MSDSEFHSSRWRRKLVRICISIIMEIKSVGFDSGSFTKPDSTVTNLTPDSSFRIMKLGQLALLLNRSIPYFAWEVICHIFV